MHKFPTIRTIDDVLPFVRDELSFVTIPHQWGTSITCLSSIFHATPMARECQGIKFDLEGNILARPYHQFYRIGSSMMRVEDLEKAGRFDDKFTIFEYLEGTMIVPIVYLEQVLFCTHTGTGDDAAVQATRFATPHRDPVGSEPWYLDFCYDLAKSNLTPIFQWCPQRSILQQPPVNELVLTAIRTTQTGEYLTYDKIQALASPYYIPIVDVFKGEWFSIGAFLKFVDDAKKAYVIRWDDGMMGKIDARPQRR